MEIEGDIRQRRDRPIGGGEPFHPGNAIASRRLRLGPLALLEAAPELRSVATSISDRKGNWGPTGFTSQPDNGWSQPGRGEDG